MKKIIIPFILTAVLMTGCASYEIEDLDNRVTSLDRRVTHVEQKQNMLARKVEGDDFSHSTWTDWKEEEKPEVSTNISPKVSMTKKEIQAALKMAGYYEGKIDGKIGPQSRKAIKDFQADNGLKVDGIVGPQTMKALREYGVSTK